MEDLDLNEVQEVPAQFTPPIEEVIKQAAINVRRVNEEMTLLIFITPFKQYTFILDNDAAKFTSENLSPSPIVKATLADLPR